MSTINRFEKTAEGAKAANISAEAQLRRSVSACLLWEDTFYESGESIADRISNLVPRVAPEVVSELAITARMKLNLRHVPLLLVREMCRHSTHKQLVASTLERVICRPDEITEFVSLYWKDGKTPLSAQAKKGLAASFKKFNEYSFAKYNRNNPIKLKDVIRLVHPKREDDLLGKILRDELETPDTWEVALSSGADKKETFTRLLMEKKLGALAFLRNLRNMRDSGVDRELIYDYGISVDTAKILPFRYIAAANNCPEFKHLLSDMMLKSLAEYPKLKGHTVLVVDNSGSMYHTRVSAKSDIDRSDAACSLAVLFREICESCTVLVFSTNVWEIKEEVRGFDLISKIKSILDRNSTDTGKAINYANQIDYDRIVVFTDEQSQTRIAGPKKKGYFVNVSCEKRGIGYGPWTHIDGFSEAVVDFVRFSEGVDGD